MCDPVCLSQFDPRWRHQFESTRSEILQASEGWITAIEHIGSTSIPNLVAAPIIDMVAGVMDTGCLAPAAEFLEAQGFRRLPLPCWTRDFGELLVRPRTGERAHQVFLTLFDGPLWRRLLAVRDRFRQNPYEARRFEEAKLNRWRTSARDPRFYHEGKALFFTHLEEQITAATR